MISNWMLNYFRHKRKQRLRARYRLLLRVHRTILAQDKDLENYALLDKITAAPAPVCAVRFQRLEFGVSNKDVDLCLRQHLFFDSWIFTLAELGRHVVEPTAPVILPFPKIWREYCAQLGVSVSVQSQKYFILYVAMCLVSGFKRFLALVRAQRNKCIVDQLGPNYQALLGVPATALPFSTDVPTPDFERHTFHRWLGREMGLSKGYPFLAENKTLSKPVFTRECGVYSSMYMPPLRSTRLQWAYLRVGLTLCVSSVVGLIMGAWWKAVLLEELIDAAYFKMASDNDLAQRYVFNSSNYRIRPLWSYNAEARGSDVVNVLYSANFIPFSTNARYRHTRALGHGLINWPMTYCMDETSKQELLDCGYSAAKIKLAQRPIDMSDNNEKIPEFDKPVVAIFDVPPYRDFFKATRGFHNGYYSYEMWSQFVEGLFSAARDCGVQLILKSKDKKNGNFRDPRYERLLKTLSSSSQLVCLDSGISASRLAEAVDGVVSMPFSSPSLIADKIGCPSVYYDPGGALLHFRHLARGLPLLTNEEDLRAWMRSIGKGRVDRAV